jgi:hypothetical protein
MDLGRTNGWTGGSTKATGKGISCTVKVSTPGQMAESMTGSTFRT